MTAIIIGLYVVSALLSLWGAVSPWWWRRRQKGFFTRAIGAAKHAEELDEQARALEFTPNGGHEEEGRRLRKKAEDLRNGDFEDSGATLTQLTSPILFGNTPPAQQHLQDLNTRKEGLGWVAAGVAVGSVASILSIATL